VTIKIGQLAVSPDIDSSVSLRFRMHNSYTTYPSRRVKECITQAWQPCE